MPAGEVVQVTFPREIVDKLREVSVSRTVAEQQHVSIQEIIREMVAKEMALEVKQ